MVLEHRLHLIILLLDGCATCKLELGNLDLRRDSLVLGEWVWSEALRTEVGFTLFVLFQCC